jgi:shikimate dehydrogenase
MRYAEVIGSPIHQSKSPAIHNYWIAKLGYPYEYRASEVRLAELEGYLTEKRADRSWLGCNVTMPLKTAAAALVDDLSPAARVTGAVNLIVKKRELLIGHNVDREGFLESVREPVLAWTHRHAVILGCGGAAAAIAYALHGRSFRVDLVARDPLKGHRLLRSLGIAGGRVLPFGEPIPDGQGPLLLVNATPLGMRGFADLELDLAAVPVNSVVSDIVTDPVETRLLKDARRKGFETVDGLRMLVGQAALSFGLLFGAGPPREHDAELRERLLP